MTKTVLGVFSSEQAAERAVNALREKGFATSEISIISKNSQKNKSHDTKDGGDNLATGGTGSTNDAAGGMDSVTDGVVSGATWGGLAGLALGAGALAVPGIGPLLAVGPLAAALTGAATGGLAGGLIDLGVPEDKGRNYESHVREGGVLAVIRVSENKADEAARILRENGAKDVDMHSATNQSSAKSGSSSNNHAGMNGSASTQDGKNSR